MEIINQTTKVLHTGKTHTIGDRENGESQSLDGQLHIKLSTPDRIGTNPEQLFSASWSACCEGAMDITARRNGFMLPEDTSLDAEIDLCLHEGEYYLQARLNVSLPGLDKNLAQDLVNTARRVCPYSKAVDDNVNVTVNVL